MCWAVSALGSARERTIPSARLVRPHDMIARSARANGGQEGAVVLLLVALHGACTVVSCSPVTLTVHWPLHVACVQSVRCVCPVVNW